ncbi:MAG: hypothetical protein RBR77_03410 [Thauera sp.]|jgi:hypothetical protein|nr:hypothetical protein [Thauera sp.]
MAALRVEFRLLTFIFAWLSASAAFAQGSKGLVIYCCDVGSQQVCGDILPEACFGRAYREVNPSGTIRRVVAAPLTAEEIAQRRAHERQQRLEAAERLRQQRLDEALLETYRSLEDLDRRRAREIEVLDNSIKTLRQRETELIERQNEFIAEAAETREGEKLNGLNVDIRNLDSEIVAQRSVIDVKMRERSAVLDRFDQDRRRYVELTSPTLTNRP